MSIALLPLHVVMRFFFPTTPEEVNSTIQDIKNRFSFGNDHLTLSPVKTNRVHNITRIFANS